MGSPSSSLRSGLVSGNAEWIELKNVSMGAISLEGWSFLDAAGKMRIPMPDDAYLDSGGFLLLVRGSTTFPYSRAREVPYTGILRNSGDDLALMDPSCAASDRVFAGDGWPAGDAAAKHTMERDADGTSWHTSVGIGGTPGGENSVSMEHVYYEAVIHLAGSGGASIASDPSGIACNDGVRCIGSYPAGTKVKLKALPAPGTLFGGWSGACFGIGSCSFMVVGPTDITASFHYPESPSSSEAGDISLHSLSHSSSSSVPGEAIIADPSRSASSSSSSPSGTFSGRISIAAVQIAGERSSDDFVKIYNASGSAIDLGGWKLKKRSSTGAEYSLRTFPEGTSIASHTYFIWANSENGFSASLAADSSSTETISADNSIALLDPEGKVADALAWGSGKGQFGEGNPFPSNPGPGQVLSRIFSDPSGPVDTGDNANDFLLH